MVDFFGVTRITAKRGPTGPEGQKGEKGDPGVIQYINGKTGTDIELSAGDVGAYTKSEVQTMVQEAHSRSCTITVPASGWTDGELTFQGIRCTKYNTVAMADLSAVQPCCQWSERVKDFKIFQ